MIRILDISHWQPSDRIDYSRIAEQVDGVLAKLDLPELDAWKKQGKR